MSISKKSFQVKLGVVPVSKFIFSKEETIKYKLLLDKKLKHWKIDFVNMVYIALREIKKGEEYKHPSPFSVL